jgi:hypothetical protein
MFSYIRGSGDLCSLTIYVAVTDIFVIMKQLFFKERVLCSAFIARCNSGIISFYLQLGIPNEIFVRKEAKCSLLYHGSFSFFNRGL